MILIFILIIITFGIIGLYRYRKKKEKFNDSNTNIPEKSFFGKFMNRSLIFIFLFILLSTNLIALSVSLQCNKENNIFFKIASGMFAFMFGVLYLIFNYYMYRIKVNNKPCVLCRNDIFDISVPE